MSRHDDVERRWAIYLRISKDDEQRGEGVERQERFCRKLFAERGLRGEIVDVYTDNNKSATDKKVRRYEYERLVDDLKNGVITGVLGYKSDRIVRRPEELEALIDIVGVEQPLRVAIECVRSGSIDLSTSGGRTAARIYAVVGIGESEQISERLRDMMTDHAARGRPPAGRRPYGYADDRVSPDPVQAPIVAEIVGRVAKGETFTRIADDLNSRRGVPTSAGAPRWSIWTIRRIATNPRYIARRIHRGKDVGPGDWTPLVDEATWRRANALLNAPDRKVYRSARRYLLTGGLIVCGNCGEKMYGKPLVTHGRQTANYTCSSQRGGCGRVSARVPYVDELIEYALFELVESPAYAKALRARHRADPKVAADVDKLRAQLEQYKADHEAEVLSYDEYKRFRAAAQERLDAAVEAMTADTADAVVARYAGVQGALAADWVKPEMTLDRRQAILRAVLDRVDIQPHRGVRNTFDESRVEPHWLL